MAWYRANEEDVSQVSGSWALMRVDLKPIVSLGPSECHTIEIELLERAIPIQVNVTYVKGEPAAVLNVAMSVL